MDRVKGLDSDEQMVLNHLYDQLKRKEVRNNLRDRYYDMRKMTNLVGSVIPKQYWRLGIVLGWSGKAVDTLARRCNLAGFSWPDGDLGSLGYQQVFDANHLAQETSQGIISAMIHPPSFIINTDGGPGDETESLLVFGSAVKTTGDWNTRARRLDNLLHVTAIKDRKLAAFTLYLPNVTIDVERGSKGLAVVSRQEHHWGIPAEPLAYKPRLGREYGSSRISRAVMALQDQASRTVIRMEAHSDIYAIPDLWMLGADMSIFKNMDGTVKSPTQVLMGRIKGIPDNEDTEPELARVDVKKFDGSDPSPHLKAFAQQAQMFSGETSIPLTSLGVSDMSNPTSSDSYMASREDLIAEAEGATDDWTPPLQRAMLRALAHANGYTTVPEEWKTLRARWRSPIHLSRAAQADAGQKQLAAVPWLAETELGLELLGLSDDQIKRALSQKKQAQGMQALLETFK